MVYTVRYSCGIFTETGACRNNYDNPFISTWVHTWDSFGHRHDSYSEVRVSQHGVAEDLDLSRLGLYTYFPTSGGS
jgi:hypothetical protein